MKKTNKNLKDFMVVAGMAVVIVGMGTWMNNAADQQAAIAKKTKTTPTPAASTDNSGYNQALKTYAGNMIQFQQSCQATPSNASFKNGARILLDNRSSKAHVVSLSGTTYSLPAYSYRVITVSAPSLPAKLGLNCDESVNVAAINVYP